MGAMHRSFLEVVQAHVSNLSPAGHTLRIGQTLNASCIGSDVIVLEGVNKQPRRGISRSLFHVALVMWPHAVCMQHLSVLFLKGLTGLKWLQGR